MAQTESVDQIDKLVADIVNKIKKINLYPSNVGPHVHELIKPQENSLVLERLSKASQLILDTDLFYLDQNMLNSLKSRLSRILSLVNGLGQLDANTASTNMTNIGSETSQLFRECGAAINIALCISGDTQERYDSLRKTISSAITFTSENREIVDKAVIDITDAVASAQAAAAKTGAAAFKKHFEDRAKSLDKKATAWIFLAAMFAVSALIAAFMFAFGITFGSIEQGGLVNQKIPQGNLGLVQVLTGKLAFLGLLIGITGWCASIYKSLTHQVATNLHRALSIQTLQAFRSAVNDPLVQDMVTAEAARAVYATVPTGLVGNESSAETLKIMETPRPTIPLTAS